jgi:hypothetical protein
MLICSYLVETIVIWLNLDPHFLLMYWGSTKVLSLSPFLSPSASKNTVTS